MLSIALFLAKASPVALLINVLSVALMIFGFGFVVFFHELGHFLAAKWVGIKVEQFAVGFGHAVFSWRKGMGFCRGSSRERYEELLKQRQENGTLETAPALGETEYRINWIPLGGYVKMLGQDDMKPGADAEDPRAFNKKSIGARMLVVSAGVIMNIILAMIGFMVLFLIGFNSPPPVVGYVESNSPAQKAGIQVGDRILTIDGKSQEDFTKIQLTTALLPENEEAVVRVNRPGAGVREIHVRPGRTAADNGKGFLSLGVGKSQTLRPLPAELLALLKPGELASQDAALLKAGDVIKKINGVEITDPDGQYYVLDQALQVSDGKPVELTVENGGKLRSVLVQPHMASSSVYTKNPLSFAGMLPRAQIMDLDEESPAIGIFKPGDIILSLQMEDSNKDSIYNPMLRQFTEFATKAGNKGVLLTAQVLRDEKVVTLTNLNPSVKLPGPGNRRGFNVDLKGYDEEHPVVAGPLEGSAAEKAGISNGATIEKVDGIPVKNWFDVRRILMGKAADSTVDIVARPSPRSATQPESMTYHLKLSAEDLGNIKAMRMVHSLVLRELRQDRKTGNPVTAAIWGVKETRDLVLQFYVTLRRMVDGSVPPENMMGPVGMVTAGAHLAIKGIDWLIWFLAMISANLAVVNFLPVPIVDGGLFTFLIIEKIQGKPLSQRTQVVAQIVGLALILGVFVFVTYQDIARLIVG